MKYIKLIEFKNNKLIWNNKLIPLTSIDNIFVSSISDGFNVLYSGKNQNNKYYFGYYKNKKYLLGGLLKPLKKSFKSKLTILKSNSISIKVSGRLGGINKARKYKLGNIKLQSITVPVDYKSNPIQTKWGKLGLKVYIGLNNEY